MVQTDETSFKKKFPNLAKELSNGESAIQIDSLQADPEKEKRSSTDLFRNYKPTVIDFIRRCNTEAEANEIIAFLEKRCEITEKEAQKLRKRLRHQGPRSFGPKKEEYYYFKESGLC